MPTSTSNNKIQEEKIHIVDLSLKVLTFDYLLRWISLGSYRLLFGESVKGSDGNKIPFFDKGQSRDWSKTLDENLKQDIEKCFKNEMMELDYL